MEAFDQLESFIGHWTGAEQIMATPWGPGGPAQATIQWTRTLAGKAIVHDYAATREGKPWLQAHAVLTPGEQPHSIALHWFDSLGFVPSAPATGSVLDGVLSVIRISPRGMTRHVYAMDGADAFTFELDSSFDAGATWTPIMRGRYVRA